jgi:hypothetical protein
MAKPPANPNREPIGHVWLRQELQLAVPAPAVESFVVSGARRTEIAGTRIVELYTQRYAVEQDVVSQLRFAFRHEPLDLGVLAAAFNAIPPSLLEGWVMDEPTGALSRRAWFLYEFLTGRILDLQDARFGNYVDVLDRSKHVTTAGVKSSRHRVLDNLLGGPGMCPTVRWTPKLTRLIGLHVDDEARALLQSYDPVTLQRAISYLYTKETHSSFAIEGETPSAGRAERFVAALKAASAFDPGSEAELVRLQGEIVDKRYAATGWRDFQNFVGETLGGYREKVHFVAPKPEDVRSLMAGWMAMTRRLVESEVDPVVAAAVSAFGFVFVHPFEDGNGRIHRFLMHHILAKRGYSPPGMIFPVSAAILRDRPAYDAVLESFSGAIRAFIQWHWSADKNLVVENDTAHLYRFFDATAFAEYLYDCVVATVRDDLKDELGYIALFDRALAAVRDIVDMPDRRASLLVRLCLQNGGRLSPKTKREQFSELTDEEIAAIEAAIIEAMSG